MAATECPKQPICTNLRLLIVKGRRKVKEKKKHFHATLSEIIIDLSFSMVWNIFSWEKGKGLVKGLVYVNVV